jgi:hypothetical protein
VKLEVPEHFNCSELDDKFCKGDECKQGIKLCCQFCPMWKVCTLLERTCSYLPRYERYWSNPFTDEWERDERSYDAMLESNYGGYWDE